VPIIKFPYKRDRQGIPHPIISIEVIHGGLEIPYEVLVDSGSESCIFDAQIAELFDVDIMSGQPEQVSGLTGGSETYYVHKIMVKINNRFYELEAGFLPSMDKFAFGIVGQRSFFETFTVKFDRLKEQIELQEYGG
jgi:hypothetical protein